MLHSVTVRVVPQSTAFAPQGSYNHIMYGGGGAWMYSSIAG